MSLLSVNMGINVKITDMKSSLELHERAMALAEGIISFQDEITNMREYNGKSTCISPFSDNDIAVRERAVRMLRRSYNNVLKELVTKSMEI